MGGRLQVGTQLVDTMNHFREAEVVREASHMGQHIK